MSALNGWHPGERAIQQKLNFAGPMAYQYSIIRSELDEQHREFHTTRLPFVPVTTLDAQGRPWGSILAGSSGEPGFITSPNWDRLTIKAKLWPGEPMRTNFKGKQISSDSRERLLFAGIGIEFSTRRRNKFAGYVDGIGADGDDCIVHVKVNEAIGNCPKYINVRELVPSATDPVVVHERLNILDPLEPLPEDVLSFIRESDTTFIGTTYQASKELEGIFPSHLGMNQRGGRAGFIRVKPSDRRTVVLPDFSGNRLMTSLGNIEATPLASLSFVNFTSGAVLYLTGDAKNVVAPDSYAIMPGQKALTTIFVTGYVLVDNALPVRQRKGSRAAQSPYSPPIRVLSEELGNTTALFSPEENKRAHLTSIRLHSPSLATFTWRTSADLDTKPGQAAILDFTSLLGTVSYQHMALGKPSSVNDDRVRTWTISHTNNPKEFSLTMREKQGGAVTGALFTIARKLRESRPEILEDATPLGLAVRLVGVSGEFVLSEDTPKKLLWIAGGVGITPFLRMLRAMSTGSLRQRDWDVLLILSTREPEVMLGLVSEALESGKSNTDFSHRIRIDIFSQPPSTASIPSHISDWDVEVHYHPERLGTQSLTELAVENLTEREAFICGPDSFKSVGLEAASEIGISSSRVRNEDFAF
jgi:ferredoxin-NADP reductase/predicted pyridoxine 5'-phosphate oxidase superfamily flavin-nucleotide-binding protein